MTTQLVLVMFHIELASVHVRPGTPNLNRTNQNVPLINSVKVSTSRIMLLEISGHLDWGKYACVRENGLSRY